MRLLISKQNQHAIVAGAKTAAAATTTTDKSSSTLLDRALDKATKIQLIKVDFGPTLATVFIDEFLSHPISRARIWESIQVEYCTGQGLGKVLEAIFALKTLELAWKEEVDEQDDAPPGAAVMAPRNIPPSMFQFHHVQEAPSRLALQSDILWSSSVTEGADSATTTSTTATSTTTATPSSTTTTATTSTVCKARWLRDTMTQGKDSIRTLDLSGCCCMNRAAVQEDDDQHGQLLQSPQLATAVQFIANGLSIMTNLHVLKLSNCKLPDTALAVLIEALQPQSSNNKDTSKLKELHLSNNECGPATLTALRRLLSSTGCTLTRLDLSQTLLAQSRNPVHSTMTALVNALQHNQSTLKVLNLSSNRLNDCDFTQLVTTALPRTAQLETLHLNDNCITDQGIFHFVAPLQATTTTPTLPLSGSSSLCSQLPSSLRTLHLHGNAGLTVHAVRAMNQAMKHQSTELYDVVLPHPSTASSSSSWPFSGSRKCNVSSAEERQEWLNLQQEIYFWGDLNRAGRRVLRAPDDQYQQYHQNERVSTTAISSSPFCHQGGVPPPSLWPHILARINRIQRNQQQQQQHDTNDSVSATVLLRLMDTQDRQRSEEFSANAIFYLLQGPVLLEH
jgi:hypothetical protein